jgi:hypothetical protein
MARRSGKARESIVRDSIVQVMAVMRSCQMTWVAAGREGMPMVIRPFMSGSYERAPWFETVLLALPWLRPKLIP